jgi:hypothetical protein
MTTTDTPRTDAAELELSEVEYPHDFYALGDLCRRLEREITFWQAKAHEAEESEGKHEAEVERLREELQGLKHAAQAVVDRWETPLWKDAEPTASVIYRLRNALASAPEEPVIKESLTTEPASEWRELGPDEVIQEGDEVFSLGMWIPVSPNLVIPINDKRKPEVRFRTRRLLPVQEQEQPYYAIYNLRDEIEALKKNQSLTQTI